MKFKNLEDEQKSLIYRIAVALAVFIAACIIPSEGLLRLGWFAIPYILVGYDVLYAAVYNLIRGKLLDECFLMSLATLGAFLIGEYPEAVAIMLFYQVGELFQDIAVDNSRRSIAALMNIRPDHARVLRQGKEISLPPEQVMVGETIIILPGERVPLEGRIIRGSTTLDYSALTGESLPQDKGEGEQVISGAVNLTGMIQVQTEKPYSESTVARILELVENSSQKKSRMEKFITRFARWYTPCVVACAALLALFPPLVLGLPWLDWLETALIFLVMSCPCAMVISIPLTFFCGLGSSSKAGILIKGANYLEALAQVNTLVMDKTGTLTQGSFQVQDIYSPLLPREELLHIAAACEQYSTHPIALSVVAACSKPLAEVENYQEMPGQGIQADLSGRRYYLGNSRAMAAIGIELPEQDVAGNMLHIAGEAAENSSREYLGYILLTDKIKEEAGAALTSLREQGLTDLIMLTGDTDTVARQVGSALGLSRIASQLLPAQKVEYVENLLEQGRKVAFIGDGINDAPVLSRADVGIAMGALGSEAAIEAADIVLMDDSLLKLAKAIKLARKTVSIARQNLWFALGTKVIIMLLAAIGLGNMWLAVFGDVGVMIIAISNALRAMNAGSPE